MKLLETPSKFPTLELPAAPFRGAESFRLLDRPIFFERKADTRLLLREIIIYRGVMLYGDSGAGKSSLINAGLIPAAVDEGFVPDRIRLKNLRDSEIIIERIAVEKDGHPPFLSPSLASEESDVDRLVLSIAEFKRRLSAFAVNNYPLLIFDQFEEFATLFEGSLNAVQTSEAQRNQTAILNLLVELLRERDLRVKVLLSFREDYLAKLTQLFALSPEIQQQYIRLTPPTTKSLGEILSGPFKDPDMRRHFAQLSPSGAVFSDDLLNALASDFRGRSSTGILNLTEVQLACLELWSSKNPDELYAKEHVEGLLRLVLEHAVARLEARDLKEPGVALLSFMVTSFGTRNVISEFDLLSQVRATGAFTDAQLQDALELLVSETKLVRRVRLREAPHYEIVSEFFAPWIAERRREREKLKAKREQQFNERALRIRKFTYVIGTVSLVLFLVGMSWALYVQYRQGILADANAKLAAANRQQAELIRQTDQLQKESLELEIRRTDAEARTKEAEMARAQALEQLRKAYDRASRSVPQVARRRLAQLQADVSDLQKENSDLQDQLNKKQSELAALQSLIDSQNVSIVEHLNTGPGARPMIRQVSRNRRSYMLFGSTALEVGLALLLIYLLLAVVCVIGTELVSIITERRAKNLSHGLRTMFGGDSDLLRQLYSHPLIRPLSIRGDKPPSYIPPSLFALALLDIVAPRQGRPVTMDYIRDMITSFPNRDVSQVLFSLSQAATRVDVLVGIERWYESTTRQLSVWYRRRAFMMILISTFLLSVALNLDTINIANSLPRYNDSRAALVAAAEAYAQPASVALATPTPRALPAATSGSNEPTSSPTPFYQPDVRSDHDSSKAQLQETRTELNSLSLPIGWSRDPESSRRFVSLKPSEWIYKIIGFLITSLMASAIALYLYALGRKFLKQDPIGEEPIAAKL